MASSAGPSASRRCAAHAGDHLVDQGPTPLGDSRPDDVELRRYTQALVGLVLGGHPGVGERLPWSLAHTPRFTRWEPIV